MTDQKTLSVTFAKQWISEAEKCHNGWIQGRLKNYQMIEKFVLLENAIENSVICGEESEDQFLQQQATVLWEEVEEAWSYIQDNYLAYSRMASGKSKIIGGDDHAIVRQAAVDAMKLE